VAAHHGRTVAVPYKSVALLIGVGSNWIYKSGTPFFVSPIIHIKPIELLPSKGAKEGPRFLKVQADMILRNVPEKYSSGFFIKSLLKSA
jgi:hypothetical protein